MTTNSSDLDNQLSPLTRSYLASSPKSRRSELGQFFTPKLLREALCEKLPITSGARILDPGVGTGEFLRTCFELSENLYLEGWDIDPGALNVAKSLVPTAVLKNVSALDEPFREEFDLVIGNPPYFEIANLDSNLRSKFKPVIGGRTNIFSLFFAVGLGALRKGGILGYVVPPSMNNGAFFKNLRSFIQQNSSINYLKVFHDSSLFEDAQTAVQLIVLEKGKTSRNFIVNFESGEKGKLSEIIFSEDPTAISKEFVNKSTLWQLGYEAVTGSLVWNQNKNRLSREKTDESVPLVWAHNITSEDEIVLVKDHPKKPQFVETEKWLTGPAIVVNRITGSVGKGDLRCAMVPSGFKFVGENHVNVIIKRKNAEPKVEVYELMKLLRQPGIKSFIQKLTGNTQISSKELTHFLPLASSDRAVILEDQESLFTSSS